MRNVKAYTAGVCAAALILAAAGCNKSTPTTPSGGNSADSAVLAEAKAAAAAAVKPVTVWDGPTSGPKAQTGKKIVYVSQDQSNAGAAGVGAGVQQAAAALGWGFTLINSGGTVTGEVSAMNQALALKPDGIVIGAIDDQLVAAQLREAKTLGIPVIGWHSAAEPGPVADPPLFTNVQSNLAQSATLATQYVIATSDAKAQIVIMTWNLYAASRAKAGAMKDQIEKCSTCGLLSFDDSPLTTASTRMPSYTASLVQRYGNKLTHVMMFNDGFADYMAPALKSLGLPAQGKGSVLLISAGDGSTAAYERIRSDQYQTATIPEPLNEHGWQIVDNLNRAFAGEAPSTYVTPLHLVVKANVDLDGGQNNVFDPDNGYRTQYRKIWGIG